MIRHIIPSGVAFAFVVCCKVTMLAGPPSANDPPPIKLTPLNALYETWHIRGFRVYVNPKLTGRADEVRAALDERLAEVVKVLPAGRLPILREVALWVEVDKSSIANVESFSWGPSTTCAWYVPLEWDRYRQQFGTNQPCFEMAGGVVIDASELLIDLRGRWQSDLLSNWLLHEFAHAYHDQILGSQNRDIRMAYQHATEQRLYGSVETRVPLFKSLYWKGRAPAYARMNEFEYFAELSVAFLSRNGHYFPFDRDDLRRHDPFGHDVMCEAWREVRYTVANNFRNSVVVCGVGEGGRKFPLFPLAPREVRTFDGWTRMRLTAVELSWGKEYQFPTHDPREGVWRLSTEAAVKPR